MTRNLQQERRQRGEDFQSEIRRSWGLVPNCWRMRISDESGSRPADEIVVLDKVNLLIEMKRKADNKLQLSDLRPNQVTGLLDFCNCGMRNWGLIFVSFLNSEVDEAFAVPIRTFLYTLKQSGLRHMLREAFCGNDNACRLPRLEIDGKPGYDLKELVKWFK